MTLATHETLCAGRSTLFSDRLSDAREFPRHLLVDSDDVIERVCNLTVQTSPVAGEAYRKIPVPHRLKAGQYHGEVRCRGLSTLGPVPISLQGRACLAACGHGVTIAVFFMIVSRAMAQSLSTELLSKLPMTGLNDVGRANSFCTTRTLVNLYSVQCMSRRGITL